MQPLLNALSSLETELAKVHTTLPHLPIEWRNLLIKILPYLVLIGGILSVLSILSLLRILGTPMMGLYSGYGVFAVPVLLMVLSSGVSAVAAFFAFPRLQKSEKLGWTYIFGASLFSGAIGILMFSVGSVLGTCIGLYLLFEVRENYKN